MHPDAGEAQIAALVERYGRFTHSQVMTLLLERGDLDDAYALAVAVAEQGDYCLARLGRDLAGRLVGEDRAEDAVAMLRLYAPHDPESAARLVELLGEADLRELVAEGVDGAAVRLAGLLEAVGRIDEAAAVLREHLPGLVALLRRHGRADEAVALLEAQAVAGRGPGELVDVLRAEGRLDALRREVSAGTPGAAEALTALLADLGATPEVQRIQRYGLRPDGSTA
jgi:hypothetical protein